MQIYFGQFSNTVFTRAITPDVNKLTYGGHQECIASVFPQHTGVIAGGAKEKNAALYSKFNFKFYQCLVLHVMTPVRPKRKQCNIISKHSLY